MMCRCADSLAGVVLAVQCMMKVHRNRNMQHYLEKPTLALARLQQADGSFGSLHGTAFALQVHNIKHKKFPHYNRLREDYGVSVSLLYLYLVKTV